MAVNETTVVQIFVGEDRRYYWRVRARNGEIIASAVYGTLTEKECRTEIDQLVDCLWEQTVPEFYEDQGREWRWRLNEIGGLCGRSSEGFSSRQSAVRNFDLVKDRLTNRIDVEVEGSETSGKLMR
jgi:uncharacterized protein YegP (UPF0339 family)